MRAFLALCFASLILQVNCQIGPTPAWSSPNQVKLIKMLTNHVSSFLTNAQYQAACNTVTNGVIQGAAFATVKTTVTNNIVSGLSFTQYASVLSKGSSLIFSLGPTGITSALSKLSMVINNNLNPFYDQMVGYAKQLKAQGVQSKGLAKNSHRLTNSFASAKRIKTVFTRVSLQFTATEWKALVSSLNGIVQFTKNGF
ncbi:hypothetical protein M3Y97_01070300 [Aphelenchoides bicaudatus]|nr:hypothetical protein M3Y97_01070300 [Aphelenchoides bicaudatus]